MAKAERQCNTRGRGRRKFITSLLALLIGFAPTVSCSRSAETEEALGRGTREIEGAKAEAKRFFDALAAPGPEAPSVWGMSDLKIFGRDDSFEIAAGGPKVAVVLNTPNRERIGEIEYVINRRDPESFLVTIPFWCSGTDDDGRAVRLRREFESRIRMNDQSEWEHLGYEFRNDMPLTFLRQVLTWLGWSFLGVPILLIMFIGNWLSHPLLRGLAGIIVLAAVGYIANVCFGSALAVLVGIVVYIALLGLIVASFNAIKSIVT